MNSQITRLIFIVAGFLQLFRGTISFFNLLVLTTLSGILAIPMLGVPRASYHAKCQLLEFILALSVTVMDLAMDILLALICQRQDIPA